MKAIILAGVETVKLTQMLEAESFATIPLANKALLERVLDQLRQAGVTQAIMSAARPSEEVDNLWNEKTRPPLPIRFTFNREMAGSASALKRLKNDLTETFLVVNLQNLVTVDLKAALEYHRHNDAIATAVTLRIAAPIAAALKTAYEVVGNSTRTPSPEFNFSLNAPEACFDSGIYILEPEALEQIPDDKQFQLEDLLLRLSEAGRKVNTFLTDGQLHSLTTLSLYWQANMDLLAGKAGDQLPPANTTEIRPGIWSGPNTKIHPAAKLQAPLIIGANVRIDQDVKLENSVIGDNVVLEQGSQIRNSVIFPYTRVGLAVKLIGSLVRGSLLCQEPNFEPQWVNDLYSLNTFRKFQASRFFRRAFNFLVALTGLIVISPILLICAIAIKLDSPGPIMYKQLRVGEGRPGGRNLRSGRVFKIYKFRTMYTDADDRLAELMKLNEYKDQAFIKIKNDPRITRVGSFLRKTSLDELPQLINVVLGDMQLVGNRPLPVYEAEALSEEWKKLRFNAPAGITGLWQISGRSDLSFEERLVLDNYYARNYSFWGDIKILIITPFALIKNKGAR